MNRSYAMTLAQQKANDWNQPYRVLRCADLRERGVHKVEQSDSYDSPHGWVLVEVFRPATEKTHDDSQ